GGRGALCDLLYTELSLGPLVDLLGAGTEGQTKHHVGQVDGLAPGGRADLDEGDVDQQQPTVADEQVGRLDFAGGQAGLPELADDAQAIVDDLIVHFGLAELGGAGEELGGPQG